MKSLPSALFFVAAIFSMGQFEFQRDQDEAYIAAHMEKLVTLHVELLGQTYCRADDQIFISHLNLRLSFLNASTKKVIFARKVESPKTVRVARSMEAGLRGDFLYAPNEDFLLTKPAPDAPFFGAAPSRELFEILAPGNRYETEAKTWVFAIGGAEEQKKGSGLLGKGSYALQVGVITWPYDWPDFTAKVAPEKLKSRWAKYGELATGLVYSDFTPFTIPEHLTGPACSKEEAK
jgi:hypothetical protein